MAIATTLSRETIVCGAPDVRRSGSGGFQQAVKLISQNYPVLLRKLIRQPCRARPTECRALPLVAVHIHRVDHALDRLHHLIGIVAQVADIPVALEKIGDDRDTGGDDGLQPGDRIQQRATGRQVVVAGLLRQEHEMQRPEPCQECLAREVVFADRAVQDGEVGSVATGHGSPHEVEFDCRAMSSLQPARGIQESRNSLGRRCLTDKADPHRPR